MARRLLLLQLAPSPAAEAPAGAATEFCLTREARLGTRYQGMEPGVDEFMPPRWFVVTENDSWRVLFSGDGRPNPDLEANRTVAAMPPGHGRHQLAPCSADADFVARRIPAKRGLPGAGGLRPKAGRLRHPDNTLAYRIRKLPVLRKPP